MVTLTRSAAPLPIDEDKNKQVKRKHRLFPNRCRVDRIAKSVPCLSTPRSLLAFRSPRRPVVVVVVTSRGGSRERKLPAWDPGHSVCAARAYRSRASRRLRCRRRRRRRNAHFYKVRSLGNSVEEERPRAGRHSAGGLLPRVCPLAGTRRVYPFFYSELRGARACARSSRVLVNKWGVLFGNEKPPLGESEFWF